MRVLIVDDEIKICNLINHLADWNQYGMEVIGMVNDGEDALDIIFREKPDIVITDIRMPGLDGLQLVEQVLSRINNIYFVIVSGYSQFEYARQAVRLGVEDYLVKPIKKKDLDEVLSKISSKYQQNNSERTEKESLQSELAQTRSIVKNNLLRDLLTAKSTITADRNSLRNKYNCKLKGKYFYLILIHFYKNSMEDNEDEQNFVLEKIFKTVHKRMEPAALEYFSIIDNQEIICLLNIDERADEEITKILKRISVDLSSVRELFPLSRLTISIGTPFESPAVCSEKLNHLRLTQLRRFSQKDCAVFWESEKSSKTPVFSSVIDPQIRKRFLLAIEIMNTNLLDEQLTLLFDQMKQYLSHEELLEQYFLQIIQIFLSGLQTYYRLSEYPSIDYFLNAYHTLYDYDDLCLWYKEEFRTIVKCYEQEQKELESRPIRQAKAYLAEHFHETLSLEIVSSHIGLNPAYFSSIFKKTTGQNFNEYVTEIRIENARTFLIQTNLEISDIAEAVGYSDVKYFSKLFKKLTSLTPLEYRKLYQ